MPKVFSDEEHSVVRRILDRRSHSPLYKLDEKGSFLTIHVADEKSDSPFRLLGPLIRLSPEEARLCEEGFANYSAMMRFELVDSKARLFGVERYCFRGSVDRWVHLAGPGQLAGLAEKFLPHLGRETFFELF